MNKGRGAGLVEVSKGIVFSRLMTVFLLAPLLLLVSVVFLGALASLVVELFENGFGAGIEIFAVILSKDLFQSVAVRTIWISVSVTVLAIVIGYATAYCMWRSSPHMRSWLIALVLFPLFTSVVVRTYAWTTLFNRFGIINTTLLYLGLIDTPIRMMKTEGAVLIGMVQVLLPFAILPIYNTLMRIDENLLRASAIAGARGWQTFIKVVLPLTKQGTVVAAILVFVISLGFYITPAILGGPGASMISNLIGLEVTRFFDLKDGAAMSLLLLLVTLLLLFFLGCIGSIRDQFKDYGQ